MPATSLIIGFDNLFIFLFTESWTSFYSDRGFAPFVERHQHTANGLASKTLPEGDEIRLCYCFGLFSRSISFKVSLGSSRFLENQDLEYQKLDCQNL